MAKKQAIENAYPSPFEDSEPLTPAEEKAMVNVPSYAGTFTEPAVEPGDGETVHRNANGPYAPVVDQSAKPRKKSGHLTNRTPWLQCAANLENVLASFPPSVADMALDFVTKARKPAFIPPEQH